MIGLGFLVSARYMLQSQKHSLLVPCLVSRITDRVHVDISCGHDSVRVSNELGRGNIKAAKFAIKVIFTTATGFGLLFAVLCLLYSYQIASLLTTDEAVDTSVSKLSVLLSISVFLNTVQPVLTGEHAEYSNLPTNTAFGTLL